MVNLFSRIYELCHEKTNNVVSEQVQHKPGCSATQNSKELEISDLRGSEIGLSGDRIKGADLRLCFCLY